MYNIFPSDGQIFISTSPMQMKSWKQAVLTQSPQPFPVLAASVSYHNDPYHQQHTYDIHRPILYSFQMQGFFLHHRSILNLKYGTQHVLLLDPRWNWLRRLPDPKTSIQWEIKKCSWSFGLTMEQGNETLKPPKARGIPCKFSESVQIFLSFRKWVKEQ